MSEPIQTEIKFTFLGDDIWELQVNGTIKKVSLTNLCKFVNLPLAESHKLDLLELAEHSVSEEMYQNLRNFMLSHLEHHYGDVGVGAQVLVDANKRGYYEGMHLHPIGLMNPRIRLHDGTVVWGIECWWEYMAYRSDITATEYMRRKKANE